MRGRKPKPTAIKKLAGNPGRRPLNENEPQVSAGKFSCPRYLDDLAKAEWRRVVHELRSAGVLAAVDRAMLEGYCISYSRMRQAQDEVKENGLVVTGPRGGLMKNPAVAIANEALTMMKSFASELGMSAASRTRLKVETPKNEPTLAELLFDNVKADQDE